MRHRMLIPAGVLLAAFAVPGWFGGGAAAGQASRAAAAVPVAAVKDNRTAQIEDPANGRIPSLTPAAKAAQEAYLATHPSTDEGSGSDVTHWDGFDTRTRCIAIQVPAGVMSYNSASYIMQSQGWVM